MSRIALGLLCLFAVTPSNAQTIDYDIAYVRQARYGDSINTIWPEVFHPARLDPGADLMLLHPNGSEELLVAGGNGGVTDPFVSFDAQWIYYSYFPDLRETALNNQRDYLPERGSDIYRIHVVTREIQRLTHGEFSPNTGAGIWDESNPLDPAAAYNRLGYGILNLAPCPLPGGRIAFTSNRNGFEPPKGYTAPTLQLFVMDENGDNVTAIAPMNISSALHPTILRDGRLLFSSHEDQGLRDTRQWGIWAIQPDGRYWQPVVSAFRDGQAFHFMTQLGNDDLVFVDYYNLNNNGFGALYRMPLHAPAGQLAFFSAFGADNPDIARTLSSGTYYPFRMPFTPRGLHSITPFTTGDDEAAPAPAGGGARVGKFTHPSAAPGNHLLVAWTPGPANDLDRPTPLPRYNSGLYLVPNGDILSGPQNLVLIRNNPLYNEAWPRAVVPYRAIHGVDAPANLDWLPNDGSTHAQLPAGTPYGMVGTSSFYKRESFPGYVPSWSNAFNGLDAFNTAENGQSSNWSVQGADAGRYNNSDIWAVRVLAMEPHSHRSYGPNAGRHFISHAQERLRILGEIPLRKSISGQPVLDTEGNPDTSFLVKLSADTPFTFQTLDRNGLVLNMSQTWHQVRPGELRADCGGCHAHSQQPLSFASTAAAQPGYTVYDLSKQTPLLTRSTPGGDPSLRVDNTRVADVEFLRDIRPLLQRSCVGCHQGAAPAGNLDLSDTSLVNGVPGDYRRLADDSSAQHGYAPVIGFPAWRQTNASRYVRMFQSRRSLLIWKLFGQRLDGWSNVDHPTETIPGNASSLPAGSDANAADIDYTGTAMPPPGSGATMLSEDEKLTVARWIDLGAPINTDNSAYGWFLDDLRPTLAVSAPRAGYSATPITQFRIGYTDADSGILPGSLSVRADFSVAGRAAGTELSDLAVPGGDGIVVINLAQAVPLLTRAHLYVSVRDAQGNITRVDRVFSTSDRLFANGFQ
ncbi:MAG: hypothetical protein ABI411_05330 [Tahibacter sp.]